MFPIRDRDGRTLGFAGLGTHLGPSWPKWVASPDAGLYQRSEAVFGIDRAVHEIATSGIALVRRDCVEVLQAHQDGQSNAVTVHTRWVTRDQIVAIADGIPGGLDALELDLRRGDRGRIDAPVALTAIPDRAPDRSTSELGDKQADSSHLKLKRVAIVIATAVAAVNVWTGAPLFSVWVGSQAQGGQVLSLRGVVTVLVVLGGPGVSARLGPRLVAQEVRRADRQAGPRSEDLAVAATKRGELDEDIRARFSLSAPEKVVAASVIVGMIAFEVWFFFFAGSRCRAAAGRR